MNKFKSVLVFSVLILPSALTAGEVDNVERLMTFFTTSSERNKLDEMRNTGKYEKTSADKGSGVAVKRDPVVVELKGLMIRENSQPVVWVNDGSTLKSNIINKQISVKTRAINKQQLKIPVKISQRRLNMKPGQQWNETDNKVKDKYQTK